MSRQPSRASKIKPPDEVSVREMIWPEFNKTEKTLELKDSRGVIHFIKPGERIILPKQKDFLEDILKYNCTLYGGALGGGKSHILRYALLYLLLKWYQEGHEKVEVAMFCETFKTLEHRQISQIRKWPSWLGKYYEQLQQFRLHDCYGGGVIQMCNSDDPEKYRSAQFAAIAVDELTLNDEQTFNVIASRCRWAGIEHCPVFAATNPGEIGHQFVLRDFVMESTRKKGYHFIQSLPSDNPFLSQQYWDRLNEMPEKLRRAWMLGDWSVFEGQFFSMLKDDVHLCKPFVIPDGWNKFRAIDHGFNHPTVCLWGAVDYDGNLWVYREHAEVMRPATWHKQRIHEMGYDPEKEQYESYVATVGDPKMFDFDGASPMNKTAAEVYNGRDDNLPSFRMQEAANARVAGWGALLEGFSFDYEVTGLDIYNNEIRDWKRKPGIRIFDSCPKLWKSLRSVIHDSKGNVEDVKKTKGVYRSDEGDDQADCLRYLYLAAVKSNFRRSLTEAESADPLRDSPSRFSKPQGGIWV